MSKLLILILYSTFALFSCEKQKSGGKSNKAAKPTPAATAKTETNTQTSSNYSAINWLAVPRFSSISATGSDKLWAVIDDQEGKLILTEDGGATWKTVREKGFSGINFADESHGWMNDNEVGQILATVDGGETWFKTSPEGKSSPASKFKFTDSLNGWGMDSSDVYHSSDGGRNWTMVLGYEKHILGQPSGWFFLDSQTGWVCDGGDPVSGNLYKTVDAGANWSIKKVGRSGYSPCKLFFVNPPEGFYSLQKQLFQTKDSGESWNAVSSVPKKFEIRSMFWHDAGKGWLAGYFETKPRQPGAGKGAILRTADGGKTWTEATLGRDEPFYTEIIFTDAQNGWLVSRDNIYKTSDGGENWRLSYSLPPVKLPPSE